MNLKVIWYPLLTVFLLSACGQRTATPTSTADAGKPLPDDAAPAIPDQPVQGTILGSAFSADQIILKDSRIRFRQGKNLFADREVAIDIPNDLPRAPVIRSGTIWLSEMKAPSGIPNTTVVRDYKLALVIGAREALGAPVQIDLEITGTNATRIVGRGFATFDDIHVVDGHIDLHWDTFDTLRHVTKEYVRRQQAAQEIEFVSDFGLTIRDPGTRTDPKTAFVGHELSIGGAPASLVKLQLQKGEDGWRVANVMPSNQIDDAHPLDTAIEGHPARTRAEVVAGQKLEAKLQREQLMPRVRGTHVSCTVDEESGHGSCDTRYELSERLETGCHLQNYRMAYRNRSWVVVSEIGPEERVEVRTGAIVKQKPSMFGCRFTPINY